MQGHNMKNIGCSTVGRVCMYYVAWQNVPQLGIRLTLYTFVNITNCMKNIKIILKEKTTYHLKGTVA
jgi:hypothetical protein